MRSRAGAGQGGKRTLTFVMKSEQQAGVLKLAGRFIRKGTTVFADEAPAYDPLHAYFPTKRVNHQVEYRSDDGVTTNMAESYFSRLRRMEVGTHHHIAGPYLRAYAGEAAWREDNRRIDNGAQALTVGASAMASGVSRAWKGYWQRGQ